MWTMPLLAFDYLTDTVSSVRHMKHCVDGQPSEHSVVAHTRVVVYRIDGGNNAATKIDSRYCQ